MKNKHSKTPWARRDFEVIGSYGSNKFICDCMGTGLTYEENNANAAHIVKCVNAHEELVNCLQAFVYQIETYNLKHEFPGAYMDAKNILNKVNNTNERETNKAG